MRTSAVRSAAVVVLLVALAAAPPAGAWTQTSFQVGGYLSAANPDPASLARLSDAGIDWVYCWKPGAPSDLRSAAVLSARLDSLRGRRRGFRVRSIAIVAEGDSGRLLFNHDREPSLASVGRTLAPERGLRSASTLGSALWDEPCDSLAFQNIGRLSRHIEAHGGTGGFLAYVNLLPIHAWDLGDHRPANCYARRFGAVAGFGKEQGYVAYLDAYLDASATAARPAPLLSFDHYPFQVPARPWHDYFWNLRLVREATARHARGARRTPFWVVVELSPYHDRRQSDFPPFPFTYTRGQVYEALAYGAKGITYWLLDPAQLGDEVWGGGVIDSLGAAGPDFAAVGALDRELHALGPTLMRLDPVASVHADSLDEQGIASELLAVSARTRRIVADLRGDADAALAGWLRDRASGDDYLLVVNKAVDAAKTFDVMLAHPSSVDRIDRTSGRRVRLAARTTSIHLDHLAPGQGELFRVVAAK